jgi:asparagine N-glycosylation enzyme membrane subunit Stt3
MLNNEQMKELLNNPVLFIFLFLSFVPLLGAYLEVDSFALSLLFASCGVLCSYLSIKRKEFQRNALPIMVIFLISYLFYNINSAGASLWAISYGIVLFFAALHSGKIIDAEPAFIIGVFLFSTFIHCIPAVVTDYIEEIDPYYDYKWAQEIYNTGVVPYHDWLTYPLKGGLDRSLMPFGNPVAIALYGKLLTLAGMGLLQSTLLISGLVAGLTAVVAYFLLKELMFNRENAKIAAMFGVMALVLSIGWSTKAHATDSENDAFGGLVVFSVLYIFMYAINRDNFRISLLGGSLLFGWLVTLWDGYRLLTMFVCIAIAMTSVIGAIKKFRTFKYLKHYLTIFLVGNFLWRIVLHPSSEFISLIPFKGIEIASFILAIFAVGFNEYMINYRNKVSKKTEYSLLAVGALALVFVWPIAWVHFYNVAIVDAQQSTVVFKTIAEQAPFADSIKNYITSLARMFGVASLMALCAIPILVYFMCREDDFGASVMLAWLAPMIWGLYFKSQYSFIASMPYALASSWVVLFVISNKKHQDGFRIIPTLVVLYAVVAYSPIASLVANYEPASIFYNVASYDRIGWESTLQYFAKAPANTAIVTWWDYGHWLTAVSHKFVLIDNLQNDHWEIQDVAKFFMRAENEEDAMKILQKYQDVYKKPPYSNMYQNGVNLDYVAIDWTMIGKSGAMRFISTGNLTNQADGEYNSYAQCGFAPQLSNINGSLKTDANGKFSMARTLVYQCTGNYDGLAGIVFTIGQDDKLSAEAVDQYGNRVGWNVWMGSHDASLFGVKSLNEVLSVSMQYYDRLNNVPPAFYNFAYGSGKFKNFMLARLYFSKNIDSYKSAGMSNVEWGQPKYFKADQSFEEGFVETWKIQYSTTTTTVPTMQRPDNNTEVFKYGT